MYERLQFYFLWTQGARELPERIAQVPRACYLRSAGSALLRPFAIRVSLVLKRAITFLKRFCDESLCDFCLFDGHRDGDVSAERASHV